MELVVSYAWPRHLVTSMLCFSRTLRITLPNRFSSYPFKTEEKSSKTSCFFGLTEKFKLSTSNRRKQTDNISLPCEVTSSPIIAKCGQFFKHVRSNSRNWSAAISKIWFWIVVLVYWAFFGSPQVKHLAKILAKCIDLKIIASHLGKIRTRSCQDLKFLT